VREDDADPLVVGRAREVMQQAQAGVVSVVDVVNGEQQPSRGRAPAQQFGRCHVQVLVRARAGPGGLGAGQDAVELIPMVIGEPIE
jgi:hypothetical protein